MCGVLGIVRAKAQDVATELYHGLNQLQHRGQDAAGMLTLDPATGELSHLRNKGLVQHAFTPDDITELKGSWGLGHVRYATSGAGCLTEAQPISMSCKGLRLSLVYNGNIINYVALRNELETEYSFETTGDTEVLLKLLMKQLNTEGDLFTKLCKAVRAVFDKVSGAYSVLGILEGAEQGPSIFAFRDPRGIRPLLMSIEAEDKAFCSETYPLSLLGFDGIENVTPGELILVQQQGTVRRKMLKNMAHRHCSFEYVYFARANAKLEGQEVYQVRQALGIALARKVRALNIPIDVVIGVPATSQPAAMAAAFELGVRLEEGFLRKDHTGRSFIMPTQDMRERMVSQKLAPVASVFKDQRVLIVDDSIVRGTTSKAIVQIARQCGAKEVTFASTFPKIQKPCYLGIDMCDNGEFIAWEKSSKQVAEVLGADNVIYNTVADLKAAIGLEDLCLACIDGSYPTDVSDAERLVAFRALCKSELELASSVAVGNP